MTLLLTVRVAARQLGISKRDLRALVETGQVPSYLVRGRRYVDPLAVRAVVDRMR